MVFKKKPDLEFINSLGEDNMSGFLEIKFTDVGDDFVVAEMPVNNKTKQPMGLLHGGANVVLAETLGSIAAMLTLDTEKQTPVGLEINANHLRSVTEGKVIGKASPIHIGRKTQVWEIRITDDKGKLSCISRLTVAILQK
jgi:1,4-dihydroxy-2-naphthoyl-CoA hydrolase